MSYPKRMLAAVVTGPKQVAIREVPLPEPAFGQVRVRLEGCGVCASNLSTWEGMPWTQYPTDAGGLGHEGWGRIDAVGKGVQNLSVGERVATLSQRAYAQYDVADASQVLPLPSALEKVPVPGEALSSRSRR